MLEFSLGCERIQRHATQQLLARHFQIIIKHSNFTYRKIEMHDVMNNIRKQYNNQ